jgi:hypothetical protein
VWRFRFSVPSPSERPSSASHTGSSTSDDATCVCCSPQGLPAGWRRPASDRSHPTAAAGRTVGAAAAGDHRAHRRGGSRWPAWHDAPPAQHTIRTPRSGLSFAPRRRYLSTLRLHIHGGRALRRPLSAAWHQTPGTSPQLFAGIPSLHRHLHKADPRPTATHPPASSGPSTGASASAARPRLTGLGATVVPHLGLRAEIEAVARRHRAELAAGRGQVDLPHAHREKMPQAASSLAWQYLSPPRARAPTRRRAGGSSTTSTSPPCRRPSAPPQLPEVERHLAPGGLGNGSTRGWAVPNGGHAREAGRPSASLWATYRTPSTRVPVAPTRVPQPETPTWAGRLGVRAGPTRVRAGPTRVGAGPTRDRAGPTHVGAGPTRVGAGPTRVGAGPTHVGAGPMHVGAGPTRVGAGPTHVGADPTHVRAGPTHVREGPTRVGRSRGEETMGSPLTNHTSELI